MDELQKALDIGLTGAAAQKAIEKMQDQVLQWGLTLPNAEPFVCDFGLGRFDEIGEVEVWIANEVDEGYCGKFLFVQDGQTCPMHSHRTKHETFYIVKGTVQMQIAEGMRTLSQGDVLPVSQGTSHSFTGIGPALLLEVSMPCVIDDNFFSNPDIPIGGNWQGGEDDT